MSTWTYVNFSLFLRINTMWREKYCNWMNKSVWELYWFQRNVPIAWRFFVIHIRIQEKFDLRSFTSTVYYIINNRWLDIAYIEMFYCTFSIDYLFIHRNISCDKIRHTKAEKSMHRGKNDCFKIRNIEIVCRVPWEINTYRAFYFTDYILLFFKSFYV